MPEGKAKGMDHRARVTTMLIRRAFTELLRQKPLQSISVKELCLRAGIHRGTFYAHYTDMMALLRSMEEELLAEFQQALAPLLEENGSTLAPVTITAEIFRCLRNNADICAVTLGEYGDKEFALRLINLGRERCVESYTRYFATATPKQLEYFYAFVSAGCIGLLEKWFADGMVASAQEMAEITESMIVYGMGFLRNEGTGGG